MKLEDFIFQSLTAITAAVQSAQEKSKVPVSQARSHPSLPLPSGFVMHPTEARVIPTIEFDIAVTVDKEEELKAGIGAALTVIGLGVKGKTKDAETSVTRIRFSLPVDFGNPPVTTHEDGTE